MTEVITGPLWVQEIGPRTRAQAAFTMMRPPRSWAFVVVHRSWRYSHEPISAGVVADFRQRMV